MTSEEKIKEKKQELIKIIQELSQEECEILLDSWRLTKKANKNRKTGSYSLILSQKISPQ